MMSLRRWRQGKGKKKEKEKVNAVKRKLQFEQSQREEEEKKKEKEHKTEREGSKMKAKERKQENVKWRSLACFHSTKNLLLRKVGYIYLFMNIYTTFITEPYCTTYIYIFSEYVD